MFNYLNLNLEAFGLDISDTHLRAVRIEKERGRNKIAGFDEIKLPHGLVKKGEIKKPETVVELIKKLIQAKGLKTKYVIASLPEEKSFSQVITMPKMSEEEGKKAIRFEAESYIPFSIDKVYLDSQKVIQLEKNLDYSEFLIAALPKLIADPYLDVLKQAKLFPLALEIESQSIARALIEKENCSSPILLLDIGESRTNFILYLGNSLRFASSNPISSAFFTRAITKNLKVDTEKAEKLKKKYGLSGKNKEGKEVFDALIPTLTDLREQINKYVGYYCSHAAPRKVSSKQEKIQKLILCGSGAELQGLKSFLEGDLGLKVELGNPLINLSLDKKDCPIPQDKLLAFTAAIGLAIRGVNDYD